MKVRTPETTKAMPQLNVGDIVIWNNSAYIVSSYPSNSHYPYCLSNLEGTTRANGTYDTLEKLRDTLKPYYLEGRLHVFSSEEYELQLVRRDN